MLVRNKRSEVVQLFRYFTGIAMLYFASLSLITVLQTGQLVNLSQIQSYANLATNGILFGYLSWSWLEKKIPRYYLPLALIAATIVPLFSNKRLRYYDIVSSRGWDHYELFNFTILDGDINRCFIWGVQFKLNIPVLRPCREQVYLFAVRVRLDQH